MYSAIAGGRSNISSGTYSAALSGQTNTASLSWSTIAGGQGNIGSGSHCFIGGGDSNTASGSWSTASGGKLNVASGDRATVSGGDVNIASAALSSIAGGYGNTTSGQYAFAAGFGNIVVDDNGAAVGKYSRYNTAEANNVRFQVGTGTAVGTRSNGLTVRADNTVEIACPSTASDPAANEELAFKRISDTSLRVSMRGADGTVRSVDLTLA